jgi:hypothetical protein
VTRATAFLNRRVVPALTVLSENTGRPRSARHGIRSRISSEGCFAIVAYPLVPGEAQWTVTRTSRTFCRSR